MPGIRLAPRGRITAAALVIVCLSSVLSAAAATAGSTKPPDSSPFEVCPVDRPHKYIDDFGHPRWSGGYHPHEGIDVFAPSGTPIRAPFDGKATTSTSWAGGLQVYVHGRDGFVFNSHLSGVGRMGKVKAGDVVGFVGDSGNARGASPHDHFEWHPANGPATNPYMLLKTACRMKPDDRFLNPRPLKI